MHNPHIGDTIFGHPHIKTLEQASTHVQVYEIMTRSDYKTISKPIQASVVLTLPNSVDSNFGLTVSI